MQTRLWPWLCAVFLFFLIWEWMRPLSELANLTQVYQVTPFLSAIVCFIVVDALRIRVISGLLVKLAVCVMTIAYFFHGQMVWEQTWWQKFISIVWNDVNLLKEGQLLLISGETRTILFLFGWAMILSAVFTVMREKKRAAWFALLTVVYLLAMQLFWAVDVAGGVVRTLAIGIVLSAAGHYFRLHTKYGTVSHHGWPAWLKWSISCLLLIGLAFPVAFAMAEQYGEDPITGIALSLGETYNISGFQPGAVEVGGNVKLEDGLLFTAITPVPTYWRGESLHIYNGKGWENDENWQDRITTEQAEPVFRGNSQAQATAGTVKQVITFASEQGLESVAGTVFAGGKVVQLHKMDEPLTYDVLISRDHVYRNKHMGLSNLANAWLNDESVRYESRPGPLDEEERNRYLQLPDELPERVSDLAKSVVGNTADPIVQVERVEHFLRRTYTYSLEVPELAADRDVVDVFLFEQMEGYCDHFSTSMVVMLRALGIPARWVKGFAPGDLSSTYITDYGDKLYEYQVKQKHAHAWVEAYLPGIGWKMFEPTPADLLAEEFDDQQQLVQIASNRPREQSVQHTQIMMITQLVHGIKRVANWFFDVSAYIRSKIGVFSFVGMMFVGSGISGFIWWVRLQLAKRRAADWMAWRWLFRKRGRPAKGQTLREYVMSRHFRSRPDQRKLWLRRLHDFERKHYGPKN